MDIVQIRKTVEEIKSMEENNIEIEVYGHILEDELYEKVLRAISEGVDNPSDLAKEALKTKEFTFSRWYD